MRELSDIRWMIGAYTWIHPITSGSTLECTLLAFPARPKRGCEGLRGDRRVDCPSTPPTNREWLDFLSSRRTSPVDRV